LGKIMTFSRRFKKIFYPIDKYPQNEDFFFPFAAVRNHLMLLASQLDLFFLPFRNGEHIHDFIMPNRFFQAANIVHITEEERVRVAGTKHGGWLNDACIDFFSKW